MATTKVINRTYLKEQFKNFNDLVIKPQFSDVQESLDKKVDKVEGYGLSKNDFTDELKSKLEGLWTAEEELAISGDVSSLKTAIEVLNGDISVTGSVAKTTADAVAAIVANAPTDFDTLKEISDWISSHDGSAAEMNSAIAENTAAIAIINGDKDTEGSIAHAVQQAVDTLEYEFETLNIDFTKLDEDDEEEPVTPPPAEDEENPSSDPETEPNA